jgi:hypothetical protein
MGYAPAVHPKAAAQRQRVELCGGFPEETGTSAFAAGAPPPGRLSGNVIVEFARLAIHQPGIAAEPKLDASPQRWANLDASAEPLRGHLILKRYAGRGGPCGVDAGKAAPETAPLAVDQPRPLPLAASDQPKRCVEAVRAVAGEGKSALALVAEGRDARL